MTGTVELINCDLKVLEWIVQGDETLGNSLNLTVPSPWTENKEVFPYVIEQIKPYPEQSEWWTYLPILREKRILLGTCGYKGPPDETGLVEIGYEVARDYRGQGFATEIARVLVRIALKDPRVKEIQAHTLPQKNASTCVLEKNGFHFVEDLKHLEDGLIWKWKLTL